MLYVRDNVLRCNKTEVNKKVAKFKENDGGAKLFVLFLKKT